jgi:gliding motility-associated-like protein
MKKLLLIALVLFSVRSFSQAITVSTTSHTVPQLVNDVLINSPCAQATNVTWRTGTNFGSSNGIGYFQNTNPNFPMPSGVVLSTGSAQNAEGPNMVHLNDGSPAWIGDADLESTLAAAGIPMTSTNATVLEFDFIPISPNFSFDFVFASEEYGNFQCQFSDAFAFLLTNETTGVTTNLAVVPNTTTPISVVTIRDFLYNSSCPSENSQYFGSFNGGSAAAGSATNYNGQTVLLNASSVLTPNTPYHIKLVIADRTDLQSDSAIFIASDSFNIGQDVLGLDLTVANTTALCNGSTYVLTTGLPATNYAFVWTKNGTTISGATGPSINVTQPGVYGVTYVNTVDTCQPITDSITIQYLPDLITPNPRNIYKCDTGAGTNEFNLAVNTPIVTAGLTPTPTVTYHASAADANNNVNPLPTLYMSAGDQTIYVRIQNPNTQCFKVKSFKLLMTPSAVAHTIPDIIKCERSLTLHSAIFSLSQQNTAVLGGQSASIFNVVYYTSLANAQTNTNAIPNPSSFVSSGQTIYVKVKNIMDSTCFDINSFNLVVNPLPLVDVMEDMIICTSYTLPPLTNGNYFTGLNGTGTPLFAGDVITNTQTIYIFNQPGGPTACSSGSLFKITILDPNQLSPGSGTYCGSYILPALPYGGYFTAAGGTGTEIPAGTEITSSQTVYVYYITPTEPFCVIDTDMNITISDAPEVGIFQNVFNCNSYTLPPISVGKYYTMPDGGGTEIPAGTSITTTQTIYVHAQNNSTPVCSDDASFEVVIGFDNPADINQCLPYTLPVLPVGNYYTGPNATGNIIPGGTIITGVQTVYIHIDPAGACITDFIFHISISQPPVDTLNNVTVCEGYTLPALTNGNYFTEADGAGTMLHAGDAITSDETIYIFSTNGTNCNNESTFTVTINPLPPINSRSDIDICNSYVLTVLDAGNYYTGPNGTGTMIPAGTVISTSQTIYIYAVNDSTPPCTAENSFDIFIFSVEADSPADVTACDSFTLPPVTIGNYYANSGGPTANTGMMHAGDVITDSTTIYIYTESGERINCSDENVWHITINQSPVVPPIASKQVCGSYTLPALSIGNYYTATGGTGTMLNAGDVLTTSQTVYVYARTDTTPACSDEKSFNIQIFNVDELPDVTTCESYVLPTLANGKYYTGPNGTGTLLNAGTAVTASQMLYIYSTSPFEPECSDESDINITIIDTPVAHAVPASLTTVCDEDGTNDGVTTFDLASLSATVLGSQTSAEFSIAYYGSVADANSGTNAITSSNLPQVFVRVSNALAPNCFDVQPINIHVNKLPEPTPVDGTICFDSETQTLLNPYTIYSGLSSTTHTFQWLNEDGIIVGSGSSYTAILPGTYTVTARSNATGCMSEPTPVVVSPSEPAIVAYSVSEDFGDSQSVTIQATGVGGVYEYQLDNGPYQDSPTFYNVSSGIHTVIVKDKNGCGLTTTEALVINYPHYFTPNGDGFHDTWNIKDLSGELNSKISIFDRYGKFIAQIKPAGTGWDGTYNGKYLPSTDYWFVVNYEKDGQKKEFKAHFAMKR